MADPKAFVCGMPIAHSRSPLIHGHWLKRYAIAGRYDRLEVSVPDFPSFLRGIRQAGYRGGNVTLPHKEAAFALVERRDGDADAIGAVNTLWFEGDTLVGGNTDAIGFSANLDQNAPEWRRAGRAVVVGAGGASRAVVHALASAGLDEIWVANRTVGRAEDLAARFGGQVQACGLDALPDLLASAGLLVNTSSGGLKGEEGVEIDVSRLPRQAIVTDIVYVPLTTPLLAKAQACGLRIVDGLGMLLHQAAPGFERWFGRRPEVTDDLRDLVVSDIEAKT